MGNIRGDFLLVWRRRAATERDELEHIWNTLIRAERGARSSKHWMTCLDDTRPLCARVGHGEGCCRVAQRSHDSSL
jgi:hypothetical protein